MRELGLFGMAIPEEYGGLGLSMLTQCVVMEQLSRANLSFRIMVTTNNGIGSVGIVLDGTEEQKKKYLPKAASGEMLVSYGLTEPGAGSDAGGTKTTAVLDGDQWVINGSKIFITNASTDITAGVTVLPVSVAVAEGGANLMEARTASPR